MSQWIGVVIVAAGALVAGVMFAGRPAPPPVVSFESAPQELTVHVTGAVDSPGLVVLRPGARVADAVAAAGGLTGEASVVGLNLASPLRDGMQVVVPSRTASADGGGLVSLSSATVDELTALPGLGPVLAQRVVDHRQLHGPFTSFEDLLDVPGIGESKLAAIRESAVP